MTNDLRKLSKDLKAFAKRCKDFKYTEQMLFVFLLCGILGFSDVTPTDKAIQTKRQEISTSIGDMRQEFKKVKSENDKLVKNYNLELKKQDLKKYNEARNLLYVSVTRAIKNLKIFYTDDVSKFSENIKEIFGDIKKFNNL